MTVGPGSRWREKDTGRAVTVTRWSAGGWPWFRYDGEAAEWHCCPEDFYVWGRFERVA